MGKNCVLEIKGWKDSLQEWLIFQRQGREQPEASVDINILGVRRVQSTSTLRTWSWLGALDYRAGSAV